MLDFAAPAMTSKSLPARKLDGRVAGLFAARGKHFVTEAVDALRLGFDGIAAISMPARHGAPAAASPGIRATPRCATSGNCRSSRRRTRSRGRAHGPSPRSGRNGSAPTRHRRRAAAVDAAVGHAAVLQERRHRQGRRAERAVPHRRASRSPSMPAWRTLRPVRCCFPRRRNACAAWSPGSKSPGRSTVGEEVSVRVPEQWIYRA